MLSLLFNKKKVYNKTVLVIDDSSTDRVILRKALQRKHLNVIEAELGEQGIALAHSSNPDVVLVDYYMPKMSGIDVCDNLYQNEVTRNIPVIVMTSGDNSAELLLQSFEKGAVNFLIKTRDMKSIIDEVESVLRN